jgi:hypothetical protein
VSLSYVVAHRELARFICGVEAIKSCHHSGIK